LLACFANLIFIGLLTMHDLFFNLVTPTTLKTLK
jgi:hypothetical protein